MSERLIELNHPAVYPTVGSEAAASLDYLYDRGLRLFQGIDRVFVEQLVDKSLEPHVQATTPRDGAERFTDFAAYQQWQAEHPSRSFFVLARGSRSEGFDLAGAVWFTPSQSEIAPFNFAIRLYHGYAGTGLACPLMAATHGRMAAIHQELSGVQLEADQTNTPAINAYRRFGYTAIQACTTSQDRVRMILSSERLAELTRVLPADMGD